MTHFWVLGKPSSIHLSGFSGQCFLEFFMCHVLFMCHVPTDTFVVNFYYASMVFTIPQKKNTK